MTRADGFALAMCLLLLMLCTILAVAGFTAAFVELRIAGNVEERDRAFQAAQYGIEQALRAPAVSTALTTIAPLQVPAAGAPIAVPGTSGEAYAYRLYYAGSTPSGLPPLHTAASMTAFHFIAEVTGYSARRGASRQVQSFKVLRPATWQAGPVDATCAAGNTGCVALPLPRPLRTSWVEMEAE